MPVVDKLPVLLREDLDNAFENDMDSVFDITHLRHSLGQQKREMEIELKRVMHHFYIFFLNRKWARFLYLSKIIVFFVLNKEVAFGATFSR